jgi:signal transduction histidine kinase
MLALRGSDGVMGAMAVSAKEMSPALVGTLELFVAHLSAALENAKLFAELGSAREQLLVRERLAAVGETAAVLAHELRNSLAVIYNGLAMLRAETGNKATTMASMQEEAERLNRLLADLLDFSRPLAPQLETVSMTSLAESATVLANRTLIGSDTPPIQLELGDGPHEIRVDQNMICHALANLLVNAAQSNRGRTGVRMVAKRKGAGVAIDVEDQGEGIPPAVLPRLFQPFFTTRPRGTGLGLALVQKIAAAHGGQVTAENLPERGARFSLWLPAT